MQAKIYIDPNLRHGDDMVGMVSMDTTSTSFKEEDRAALNLVCIIDTSHSMKDGKLELVKATLDFVTEHLSSKDKMCVVQFGSKSNVVFDLVEMNNSNKGLVKRKIHNMRCDGCTNLSGGLLLGLNVVSRDMESRETEDNSGYSVLVFTDGEANRGITEIPKLVEAVTTLLQDKSYPIKEYTNISTFGFGVEHDTKMLSEISCITNNGAYYYIEDQDSIGPQFVECLGGLLSLTTQNTTLKIKSGTDIGYTVPKVWNEKISSVGFEYIIPVGDLYYGQQRNIVFTFKPVTEEFTLECELSYFDVIENEYIRNKSLRKDFKNVEMYESVDLNPDLIQNYHRVIVAECIKESTYIAESDLGKAKTQIRELLVKLESRDCEAILLEDLKKCLNVMENKDLYMDVGRATLKTIGLSHETQRSSHYTTPYQNVMINRLSSSESYKNICSTSTGSRSSTRRHRSIYQNIPSREL